MYISIKNRVILAIFLAFSFISWKQVPFNEKPSNYSGIYPQLAYYNSEGECGTGAVVPWANRLWVVTYGPHLPFGSSDKLYEITPDLKQFVRPESTGGTPANRFIHKESNLLFIGPYAIDSSRNVKVISYDQTPGRFTGMARHLYDPQNKMYLATMEEGFYEVDVHSKQSKTLYKDGNIKNHLQDDSEANKPNDLLPGAHGKGLYSGQGVMVYSNNGEACEEALINFNLVSGALSEWNGKTWKVIRRNQFVEVTGPGGIYGNSNPEKDPIWVTGWDSRSIIVGVRDLGKWSFYRLPKASNSYDGAHGWNTEWPRIRNIGTIQKPEFLMTMHGMFWNFPATFASSKSAGIRPRSAYLKVIGDFTRWENQLVFGCDDSAQKEFLNKRKAKGNIEGPGQSNSNLWFTSLDKPDKLGATTANGAVWIDDKVNANEKSEPFLFSGWNKRCVWIRNAGNNDINLSFEVDIEGNNKWSKLKKIHVPANQTKYIEFNRNEIGEWIRVVTDQSSVLSVEFSYTDTMPHKRKESNLFEGLSFSTDVKSQGGLLYSLGNNKRALGVLAGCFENDKFIETGYYELDSTMNYEKKIDFETSSFIRKKFEIPQNVLSIEESSVLIIDDQGRRWRLPLGKNVYKSLINSACLRICREIATERDLFNCMGTFYELPAENADGFAKIRPISTHDFRIHDYASYRGMLILSGLDEDAPKTNTHIIRSKDGKSLLWAGVIDDLWELGKPTGHGGPWKDSKVKAKLPSDPYLIGFYDEKNLQISHDQKTDVVFTLEVNPIGHGSWIKYLELKVKPNEQLNFKFPENFQARWIRFSVNKDCTATTFLNYR